MGIAVRVPPKLAGNPTGDDARFDDELQQLLDGASNRLVAGDTSEMDGFVERLNAIRHAQSPAAWRMQVAEIIAPHPVLEVLHTEPVTRHAYTKPRGYPGDAALIDLIYGESAPPEPLSPLARHLHAWATSQQGFESVRDRRDRLTRLIDVTAAERKDARILSLACGHLREARRSTAVRDGTIAEFVALDQDRRSLDTIACDLPAACVTRVNASIRRFLVDASMYGTFDLIYAAGLYDYLDDDLARRLTTSIAAALRPGGSMLVANFAPELREAAYMEAVMRWNLIYRNEDQVRQFAADISPETLADATVSRDALGNIVYLSIRKC